MIKRSTMGFVIACAVTLATVLTSAPPAEATAALTPHSVDTGRNTRGAFIPPRPGGAFYMLVNDLYDNPMYCLSANNSPMPGGSGTYQVYLARCNPRTEAQWWALPTAGIPLVMNYEYFDSGTFRCLSTNNSRPSGGGAGTYQVYTRVCPSRPAETNDYNRWTQLNPVPYKVMLRNHANPRCLSASSSNPLPGGTYRAYTTNSCTAPGAHLWRPWQPEPCPECLASTRKD